MLPVKKCACSFLSPPPVNAGEVWHLRLWHSFTLALATDAGLPRCTMAKKRKAEEHPSTLHDFFGASSGAKRKKSAGATQKKPTRMCLAEEEIIEITDSEEEKSTATRMGIPQMSDGFGKPLDCLLHGGSQSQDKSRYMGDTQESNSVPVTPGSAALLEPFALQHTDSSFSEGDSEGYESYNSYVITASGDEWGVGDDERTTTMDVDEADEPEEELDDDGKVVLPPESQENGEEEGCTCPLCGHDLSEFDEEVCLPNLNRSVWVADLMDIWEGYVTPCEQLYRYDVPTDPGFQSSMRSFKITWQGVPPVVIIPNTDSFKPCTRTCHGACESANQMSRRLFVPHVSEHRGRGMEGGYCGGKLQNHLQR